MDTVAQEKLEKWRGGAGCFDIDRDSGAFRSFTVGGWVVELVVKGRSWKSVSRESNWSLRLDSLQRSGGCLGKEVGALPCSGFQP